MIVSLSIRDDMILKTDDDDVEQITDKFHDLRDKILYML